MTKTMTIKGMMCGHCEARVRKTLEELEHVTEAQVSHEKGTAVVCMETEVADEVLKKAVLATIRRTVEAFETDDLEGAMEVEPLEQVVDALVKEVKSRHVRRLRDGLCSVEYGFVLEDLLTAWERSADHCSNVAVEMLQMSQGKPFARNCCWRSLAVKSTPTVTSS